MCSQTVRKWFVPPSRPAGCLGGCEPAVRQQVARLPGGDGRRADDARSPARRFSPRPPSGAAADFRRYLVSAICTPFCKMVVKAVTMLADIWASVPVMIWVGDSGVEALVCVPA